MGEGTRPAGISTSTLSHAAIPEISMVCLNFGRIFWRFSGALFWAAMKRNLLCMPNLPKGTSQIPDLDEESLGPAMRALDIGQRRFAMAAVQFPLAKDWQIARAAGYSDFSHGALRVTAHRLFHNDKVLAAINELAVKEIRSSALLGIATLKKIARRDGDKDQLKAAAHLVGLAGHTIEQKISVQQTVTDATDRGIEDRIRRMADRLVKLGHDPGNLLGLSLPTVVEGEFSEVKGTGDG